MSMTRSSIALRDNNSYSTAAIVTKLSEYTALAVTDVKFTSLQGLQADDELKSSFGNLKVDVQGKRKAFCSLLSFTFREKLLVSD